MGQSWRQKGALCSYVIVPDLLDAVKVPDRLAYPTCGHEDQVFPVHDSPVAWSGPAVEGECALSLYSGDNWK